jgi:hypothetical protein
MKPIPTTYGGFRFRSRLEARWAAFFDAIRWPWQYEPLDLMGYIPDFVLPFRRSAVLAEVRPIVSTEWEHTCHDGGYRECLVCTAGKIECSGWNGEYLVLGSQPVEMTGPMPLLSPMGHLGDSQGWGNDAAELFRCLDCDGVSLSCSSQGRDCRRCGARDRHRAPLPKSMVADAWRDAHAATAWRAA